MKLIFTIATALLLSFSSFAQVPPGFSYQAIIRNSGGALVSNQAVRVRISILQGSATGTAVYVETHATTTNANGLMSLVIGGGTAVSGNFFTLFWPQGSFFLKTETDPLGGTNYTITGTTQLLSVPYAMYAQVAASVQGHYIGELFGGGIVFTVWRDHLGVQHGLIASLDNLGSYVWANPIINSYAVGTSTKDGAVNTAAIVAALGANAAGTAAGVCDAYTGGTFTDWYLPALMEMHELYDHTLAVNAVLDNDSDPQTNGLNEEGYWSSSLAPKLNPVTNIQEPEAIFPSFTISIGYGRTIPLTQTLSYPVRAVRRF